MIEAWEKFSYREQLEYNPEDWCEHCGNNVGIDSLYETINEDGEIIFVCKECLKYYEEAKC